MRMPSPTTSRPTRAGALALTLVGGVLAGVLTGALAGCSRGEAGPSPTVVFASPTAPTTSPSPTASPTPTPDASVKPERPAAMDEVSAAGAEAVAVYFLQLDPYVYATNDLTEWEALSHPECVFCKSVSDHVKEQIAAGSHSTGGLVTISSVKSTVINPGKWWSVDIELTQTPSATLDRAGRVIENAPETKSYHMDMAVVYDAGHWVVRALSHTRID